MIQNFEILKEKHSFGFLGTERGLVLKSVHKIEGMRMWSGFNWLQAKLDG